MSCVNEKSRLSLVLVTDKLVVRQFGQYGYISFGGLSPSARMLKNKDEALKGLALQVWVWCPVSRHPSFRSSSPTPPSPLTDPWGSSRGQTVQIRGSANTVKLVFLLLSRFHISRQSSFSDQLLFLSLSVRIAFLL